MKNVARGIFWWPNLDKDIEKGMKDCEMCATTQADPRKAPLHPWQWPEKPWKRVHIDYAGPFLGSMFLVAVDAYSKWVEIIPTTNSSALTTINVLMTMFSRYGLPEHLVSDNAAIFTSEEFEQFTKVNGVKHIKSAPYHPATNGLAERMVKSFKSAMKSATNDRGTIHTKLAKFLLSYRNAPHSTTGVSPATLMFGRKLRTKLDMLHPDTRAKVAHNQSRQVASHSQANPTSYAKGDPVLARDYRGQQRWQHAKISSQQGPRNFTVDVSPGKHWKRHADQLTKDATQVDDCESTPAIDSTDDTTHEEREIPPSPKSVDLPKAKDPPPSPKAATPTQVSSPHRQKSTVTRAGRTINPPRYLQNYV